MIRTAFVITQETTVLRQTSKLLFKKSETRVHFVDSVQIPEVASWC